MPARKGTSENSNSEQGGVWRQGKFRSNEVRMAWINGLRFYSEKLDAFYQRLQGEVPVIANCDANNQKFDPIHASQLFCIEPSGNEVAGIVPI